MNRPLASVSAPVVAFAAAPRRRARWPLALASSVLLVACGGGGDGDQTGGGATAERDAYFASLEGAWSMTGSDLVMGGAVPIPTGLESGTVTLDVFRVEPVEGPGDDYACVYKLTLPGSDLTSPSFGPQLSAVGAAVHPQPMDAPFWLGGFVYRPGDDLTIEFGVVFAPGGMPSGGGSDGFAARYEFWAYDGYQLESVEVNEPGVDDDLDGLIDEPGEFALEDRIAPGATLLDFGEITVEFRRQGA